jgi:hypothetical protein
MKSEVFDNFIKIATEKGLISEGEAEHTEQNTKNPRWDSLDISAIEALYGVKPEQSKGMDYDYNIVEVAHPNSVVVAPSYDKLNGLVENINERQNILMHILFKEPEMGSPNQGKYPMNPGMLFPNVMGNTPKYAHKDLLLSLVRVANDMDNKDKEELRVLADICLNQLHSRGLKKEAFLPWLIAAAVILGVTYMEQHLADTDQGLKQNYSRLQGELQDFLTADVTLGFGHKYDDFLKSEVTQLQSQLNEFWSSYTAASQILLELEKPHNTQDLVQQSQRPDAQAIVRAYEVLRDEVNKLYPILDKVEKNFNSPDFKAEHTADKGTFTGLLDQVPFLHGGKSTLTADDFDDVVNAVPPFKDSIKRLMAVLAEAGKHKDAILEETQALQAKTQTEIGSNPFGPGAHEPAAPASKTVKDIDNESSGIENSLKGLMDFIPGMGN